MSARGRGRGSWRARGGAGRGQSRTQGSGNGPTISTPIATNASAPRSAALSTGKRTQMEMIPWISRSSGLDKEGDSLKNHKLQEEYRAFLEDKVKKVMSLRIKLHRETPQKKKHREEEQENLLILFRKLREGISSSSRVDSFSTEVYETSLYLSIIFASPNHTTVIVPTLLNDLYPKILNTRTSPPQWTKPQSHKRPHISLVASLLHVLISKYPSQSPYHQQISSTELPKPTQIWFQTLTSCLRRGNYHHVGLLTRHERISRLFDDEEDKKETLGRQAVMTSIDILRAKARESMWNVIRSAYRELWFEKPYADQRWFGRYLCLDENESSFDEWLLGLETSKQIIPKEGSENRWIIMKR